MQTEFFIEAKNHAGLFHEIYNWFDNEQLCWGPFY